MVLFSTNMSNTIIMTIDVKGNVSEMCFQDKYIADFSVFCFVHAEEGARNYDLISW